MLLEDEMETVPQPDGRSGRLAVLMLRSRKDDDSTERLVIELKRPTVKVGPKELDQIKGCARAIIDDPQYRGVNCKWRFYLVTYDLLRQDPARHPAEGPPCRLSCPWLRLFSRPVSDSILRRTLEAVDGQAAARVERARAVVRRVVWTLLTLRPGGSLRARCAGGS